MNNLQVKYFLATARCLNFTDAAEQLHISQPALSQQISAIEQELNMQLFVRAKRKVFLTPAGAVLLNELPKYEALYGDIINLAKTANEGKTGFLRIGFLEGQCIQQSVLEKYLAFKREHPNVALEESCHSFGDLRNQLSEGKLDMVYTTSFEVEHYPSWTAALVAEDHPAAYISRYHPLAKETITRLDQLRNEVFLFLRNQESPNLNRILLEDCEKAGFIPNIKYVASLDEALLNIELCNGIGISNQDSYAAYNPNIIALKKLKLGKKQNFVFAWRKENMNASLALFSNYMIESICKGLDSLCYGGIC